MLLPEVFTNYFVLKVIFSSFCQTLASRSLVFIEVKTCLCPVLSRNNQPQGSPGPSCHCLGEWGSGLKGSHRGEMVLCWKEGFVFVVLLTGSPEFEAELLGPLFLNLTHSLQGKS